MQLLFDFLEWMRNLEPWLQEYANNYPITLYIIVFAIIFAETGLVVTPFLPGDSLLFGLGVVASYPDSQISWPVLVVLLVIAAVLGDAVNYSIGYRLGPAVFRYEKSWLFNKNHLLKAQAFYEKYGAKTIILARFVPIVRTFAPFVAGVGKMEYRRFGFYNVIGAVLWVGICVGAGRLLGGVEFIKKHFELVVVAIIVISVIPMVVEFLLHHFRKKEQPTTNLTAPKSDTAVA